MTRIGLLVSLVVFVILTVIVVITTTSGPVKTPPLAAPTVGASTQPVGSVAPVVPKSDRVLNVGIVVSDYSANGPHWTEKPYGYSFQFAADELRDSSINLIALIEPGTEKLPEIENALATTFKGKSPVDVSDPKALSALDVIVSSRAVNMKPEEVAAVNSAVKNGVGFLLWADFGDITPGYDDPNVVELSGLEGPSFGSNQGFVQMEVVNAHPILGKLKPGDKIKLQPSGAYGVLKNGTPLVKVADPEAIAFYPGPTPPVDAGVNYYPIYTSTLGKGRIVGCSFPSFRAMPRSLNQAVGGKFLLRCVKWLAERDSATTQP